MMNAPATPDAQDAALWRQAEGEGRVMRQVDVELIDDGHLSRDRLRLDPEAMDELIASVRMGGVRLPVELAPLPSGRYGLVSGLRRVAAVRALGREGPGRVPALICPPSALGALYRRMVEENEVRAQLSPYERGRVAVAAAAAGAFASPAEAVDLVFAAASRAKRYKIRAFVAVHEALGDLIAFPEAMTERLGLRLAAALKDEPGAPARLRTALEEAAPADAGAEARALERALAAPRLALREEDGRKAGGRGEAEAGQGAEAGSAPASPSAVPGPARALELPGLSVVLRSARRGHSLLLSGPRATPELADRLMALIERIAGEAVG